MATSKWYIMAVIHWHRHRNSGGRDGRWDNKLIKVIWSDRRIKQLVASIQDTDTTRTRSYLSMLRGYENSLLPLIASYCGDGFALLMPCSCCEGQSIQFCCQQHKSFCMSMTLKNKAEQQQQQRHQEEETATIDDASYYPLQYFGMVYSVPNTPPSGREVSHLLLRLQRLQQQLPEEEEEDDDEILFFEDNVYMCQETNDNSRWTEESQTIIDEMRQKEYRLSSYFPPYPNRHTDYGEGGYVVCTAKGGFFSPRWDLDWSMLVDQIQITTTTTIQNKRNDGDSNNNNRYIIKLDWKRQEAHNSNIDVFTKKKKKESSDSNNNNNINNQYMYEKSINLQYIHTKKRYAKFYFRHKSTVKDLVRILFNAKKQQQQQKRPPPKQELTT